MERDHVTKVKVSHRGSFFGGRLLSEATQQRDLRTSCQFQIQTLGPDKELKCHIKEQVIVIPLPVPIIL